MRSTLNIAIRYTIVTTILLGIVYPLVVTGLAQLTMRDKANGQLIVRNGQVIGSAIIGQGFASTRYFHSRPSAAGNGYDATNSGGSNLAQSNKALVTRIDADVANWQKLNPGQPVPIGLVTTSASGLDPDLSPADALLSGCYGCGRASSARSHGSRAGRIAHSGPPARLPRRDARQRSRTQPRPRRHLPHKVIVIPTAARSGGAWPKRVGEDDESNGICFCFSIPHSLPLESPPAPAAPSRQTPRHSDATRPQ